jgi:hypothetical protein
MRVFHDSAFVVAALKEVTWKVTLTDSLPQLVRGVHHFYVILLWCEVDAFYVDSWKHRENEKCGRLSLNRVAPASSFPEYENHF